jgi:2-polyprenyl-3-methyl-5-hydroxy-6-metoxy-1,4-benzoquinol methylase
MINYFQCPVCKCEHLKKFLSVKDHSVSQEQFEILQCQNCSFCFTQNIPEQENIGKYYASENYISHSDTQQGIVNKLYHVVRKITLNSKKNLIQKETLLSTGKILDIGCGTGAFLQTMKNAGWDITGLEPDAAAREKAKSLYDIEPQPSPELFNFSENKFDAITMWHVLEHVHQLQEYIAQLKKILTPNGKIFIAVPNYISYDAEYYGENWAAYDVPRHLYHFSPQSMQQLMQQHGLKIKQINPMWFDSFYVSMLSEKYLAGKDNIFKAFFIGMISNIKALINNTKCSSLIYVISKV